MIYNKSKETMPREAIKQLQLERLQMTLNRVYRNVAFYKKSFDDANVNAESIKRLDDLALLPFTTRGDLQRAPVNIRSKGKPLITVCKIFAMV